MSTSEHVAPQPRSDLELFFPTVDELLDQDEEWCEVVVRGTRRRIRFHDYHELYEIRGLYEEVFSNRLQCQSPRVITRLINRVLAEEGIDPAELRVLDVGAGNGMVGEELRKLGARSIYGIDIIPEAATAAGRDRPGVYDDYLVADLTDLSPEGRATLAGAELNTMTTVAALGFGDMPPLAFVEAYNLISTPGWVAFNIKEHFVRDQDSSGFSRLIRRMLDEQAMLPLAEERYQHRLSVQGNPLYYVAFVARKERDVSEAWID